MLVVAFTWDILFKMYKSLSDKAKKKKKKEEDIEK